MEGPGKSISDKRIQTLCLMVLAGVAGIYLVYWLRPVLVPFVVACFIVSGVGPILTWLERRFSVSRLVAAGMAFLLGVALMGIFGLTIWVSIIDLSTNAGDYRKRVGQLVMEVEERLPMDLLPSRSLEPRTIEVGEGATETERHHSQKMSDATRLIDTFVRDGISVVSQAFVTLVSTSVVVLIYVFFLLLGNPNYAQTPTLREIDTQIRNYLSLKTVISIMTGAVFGITLRLFGVPMALSFGVLAFLLNFIPNVGPIVASLLPIPLILLDPSGNIVWMVAVIAATATIQLISGNVVEPKLMGNSSDLHPVTILLALMFWGMMWGIIGMFLATPITAAIKIVLERFELTRPIASVMAGRFEERQPEDDSQTAQLASP